MDFDLKNLENFIEKRIHELKIPGLGIGIVKDNSVLYSRGFGYADIENRKKITPNNVFRVGSISKTFTAIGIMQQLEQGKIDLNENINKYLPNGKIYSKKRNANPITFKHILTHTSGIGEILKRTDLFRIHHFVNKNIKKIYSHKKLFNRKIKLKITPGEKWAYANFALVLLGFLLELISGMEFSRYMIENIFNPLEMNNSDFKWSNRVKPLQAKGYKLKKGKNIEFGTETQIQMPAGSLYTSINDMMNYIKCLLNGGKFNNSQIIKSETLQMMWKPQYRKDERLPGIGYIFWIFDINGYRILNHGGSINGYLSEMYIIPNEKLGIIVCINQMSLKNMGAIRIAHEILHNILKINNVNAYLKKIKPTITQEQIKKLKGRYGPTKGFLTNFRFFVNGGEIKIKPKNGDLIYKTMWGNKKKGVKLWQADQNDPFFYRIIDKLDYGSVEPYETVVFNVDSKGNVKSLIKGFNEYIKKPWYRSFKFKLYSRIFIILFLLIFLIFFLI